MNARMDARRQVNVRSQIVKGIPYAAVVLLGLAIGAATGFATGRARAPGPALSTLHQAQPAAPKATASVAGKADVKR
jgi:hypothetical protein